MIESEEEKIKNTEQTIQQFNQKKSSTHKDNEIRELLTVHKHNEQLIKKMKEKFMHAHVQEKVFQELQKLEEIQKNIVEQLRTKNFIIYS